MNGSYLVFRQLRQDVHGLLGGLSTSRRRGPVRQDPAAARRGWPPRWSAAGRAARRWSRRRAVTIRRSATRTTSCTTRRRSARPEVPDRRAHPPHQSARRARARSRLRAVDRGRQTPSRAPARTRLRPAGRARRWSRPTSSQPARRAASAGLHFICFNTHIGRQFEFIQHTWVNNPKFDGLYEDDDPLVGDRGGVVREDRAGTFTVQAEPVRTRVTGMPRFVQVRGGGLFLHARHPGAALPGALPCR